MALAYPNYVQQRYGSGFVPGFGPPPPGASLGIGPYAYGGSVAPTTLRRPAPGLDYHTYTPAKGGWKLPAGMSLAFAPGKGYYARAGAGGGAAPAAPKAPTDPWAKLLTQAMGSIETPAQQEARVNREIDRQIAAQQKVMDDEYAKQRADALASFQAQALAGQAAAAMNKDLFASVGGEFNAAAGEMKGLAHGLSKNAQGATAGDVSTANAALSAFGNAPVTEGGTFGVGGGTQQGVEEYRGGTLPGQMFGTQGEAANFGLAGMIGSQALQATQEATAALIKTERDINDAHSKALDSLTSGRLDLYHTYMADARDAQIKYISLAQGLQAAQAAGKTKPITRMVGGNLMQLDPVTNTWKKVVAGDAAAKARAKATAEAAKAARPNSALSKVYGYVVDSNGNPILKNGQRVPVAKTADTAKANLQLSRALGKWVDANGVPIPSLNKPGAPKPPPFFKPGAGKKPKAVTKETRDAGWEEIRGHQLLVRAQQKLAKYNARQIAAGAERSKGVPWKDKPMTMDELSQLSPDWKADIGLTDAEAKAAGDPHTLQEVYIDLVHSGIKARDAWLMIRKIYPKFGAGYFH